MVLGSIFSSDLIKVNLESEEKEEAFEELVELLADKYPEVSRSGVLAAVRKREAKLSTGIKSGIAIPHAQTKEIRDVRGLVGISRPGIDYDALDGKPVHLVFMVLSSGEDCSLHLRVLKRLALLLENPEFSRELLAQKDSQSAYKIICKYEDILATSM